MTLVFCRNVELQITISYNIKDKYMYIVIGSVSICISEKCCVKNKIEDDKNGNKNMQ